MKFTTNNVQTSLTLDLAAFLRGKGFDVRWHATGDTEGQTAGLVGAKDTVTFVPDFPENPAFIVRKQGLNGDSTGAEEVVVPAVTVQALHTPTEIGIIGLGHPERDWEREIRVEAIAADAFQHRELADLLHEWLLGTTGKAFTIYDYDADPGTPVALDEQMRVVSAYVRRTMLPHEVEAVRPYINATAVLAYIE